MPYLFVYDIDDTLFRTSGNAKVVDSNGQHVATLSPGELNSYVPGDGEYIDYGEFKCSQKFNESAVPITKMIENLLRIQAKVSLNLYPGSEIIFITARSEMSDMQVFLDTFKKHGIDIDTITVYCSGNQNAATIPERKMEALKQHLKGKHFTEICMYDDHLGNLQYFLQLQPQFPETKLRAAHVTRSGSLTWISGENL